MLASLFATNCKHNGRALLEQQYTEARSQFLRGYDDQAQQSAQHGFDRSAGDPDLNWKFRILQAEILVRHERPAEALKSLGSPMHNGLSQEVSWRRALTLASAQCKLHNDSEARLGFSEAGRISGSNLSFQAELAVAGGRCEIIKKNLAEAEKLFQQALQSAQADDLTRLDASHGLALCALRRGQNEKGIELLLQVLASSRALKNDYFEERSLGGLGYAYAELGVFNKALDNSKAAEELAGKLHQTQDQEKWQLDIGRAYLNILRWGLAQDYYSKALNAARALHDETTAAKCLHNLAEIELEYGTLPKAVQYHEENGKLNLEGADLRDWNVDEAMIASRKNDPRAESLLRALLPQVRDIPRLQWSVEAEVARIYERQSDPAHADEWFRRSIKTMDDAAVRYKVPELQQAMLGNWPILDNYLKFLVAQEQRERSLQVAQLARARTLTEQLGVKPGKEDARAWVARIKAMLRTRKAMVLAYYTAEHATFVWTIGPRHLQVKKLPIEASELETLAASYAREIDDRTALDSSSAAKKLFTLLVKPVRDAVPPGTHVILVADSALYQVNFESLISDEGQPHYWIDDVEIENASSLDLLLAGQTARRNGRGVLLIGAPEEVEREYPRLPNAPEEIKNVQRHFPAADVKVFSGKEAVPEAYTGGHPGQFKYVDFATHGTADPSDPMNSAIILSRGPHGAFQLYARDIVKPELKLNAELVTISTCYGAGKDITSFEGLLGLQRAFLRAGARQVIAALWNVSDETSPAIMDRLYEGIAAHESAAKALRAAKLKLVHSGDYHSAPYYWAPLQLYTGR